MAPVRARIVLCLRCSRPAPFPRLHCVPLSRGACAGSPANPRLDVYTRLGHGPRPTAHARCAAAARKSSLSLAIQRPNLLNTQTRRPSALNQTSKKCRPAAHARARASERTMPSDSFASASMPPLGLPCAHHLRRPHPAESQYLIKVRFSPH
ncbi:hypothetical protein B0H15DRAFT_62797 [Mycena belliarum]|uniref:Uncharacterized protein n=1 Tax=Mycena belliarum TaxID=1033014 RepID=A0AAD6XIM2_9AGAR|nr:hypothetical protein B0H15DRAFT_62797 [Mycena belliae]